MEPSWRHLFDFVCHCSVGGDRRHLEIVAVEAQYLETMNEQNLARGGDFGMKQYHESLKIIQNVALHRPKTTKNETLGRYGRPLGYRRLRDGQRELRVL